MRRLFFLKTKIGRRFFTGFLAVSLLTPALVGWLAIRKAQSAIRQETLAVLRAGSDGVIVLYGLLLCLHPWLLGSFLVLIMSVVTLSFLITTPECWVPPLGDVNHGFPFLSGAGRLVIKDAIMMGAALVTMADSAKAYLRKHKQL